MGSESKKPKVFENLQENLSKYLISNCLKNWKVCEKREFYCKIMKYLSFYLGILQGVPEAVATRTPTKFLWVELIILLEINLKN